MAVDPRNYRTINGTTYWKEFDDAKAYAQDKGLLTLPETRLVPYDRGWAIQRYKSGPYYNVVKLGWQ